MDSYKIVMTPDATEDLMKLRNYIAYVLFVPDTALSYIQTIRKEIQSLSVMPRRNKPVDDEPWHTRGIRRIMAKNFYIYYRVDESAKCVYILNIIYAKRDQLKMLVQMNNN